MIAELSTTSSEPVESRQHDGEARRPEGRPQEASAVSLPVPAVTRSLRSRPPARMGGGGSEWRNRRPHCDSRQGRWTVDQERPLRRMDQVGVNGDLKMGTFLVCENLPLSNCGSAQQKGTGLLQARPLLLANEECPHFQVPIYGSGAPLGHNSHISPSYFIVPAWLPASSPKPKTGRRARSANRATGVLRDHQSQRQLASWLRGRDEHRRAERQEFRIDGNRPAGGERQALGALGAGRRIVERRLAEEHHARMLSSTSFTRSGFAASQRGSPACSPGRWS